MRRGTIATAVGLLLIAAGALFAVRLTSNRAGVAAVPGMKPAAAARNSVLATPVQPMSEEQRDAQLSNAIFMNSSEVEPLSVERLRTFLPRTLAGFAITSVNGERNEQTGIPVTTVSATYAAADGKKLALDISDLGGPKGLAAYAGWALLGDRDNVGDEGFEKAFTVGTRHYYQQWDKGAAHVEDAVVVAGRYAVSVQASGSNPDNLNPALDGVDLDALERLN